MHSATDLAYLAGMIDGDGYITAARSQHKGRWYFGPRVGIAGTRREPHDLAASLFGGTVRMYAPTGDRAHHRPQFQWGREGSAARDVIAAILPYLRIKRPQAALAVELQDDLSDARLSRTTDEDVYPWAPAGYDPTPSIIATVDDLRALNQPRRAARTWDEYPG